MCVCVWGGCRVEEGGGGQVKNFKDDKNTVKYPYADSYI